MSGRDLYEGYALQAVDEKGRVAIPADLRAAVEKNAEPRIIVIGKHPTDPCLTGHDTAWSQAKLDRIDRPDDSPYSEDGDPAGGAKRRAFGLVERVPFDASGRFVLPPFFRAKAGIGKWAFFNGAAQTFEIWSPEALLASEDPGLAGLRDACEFELHKKGVTL